MKHPEIPALTGLRGVAALLVVWNHYFHWCAPFPADTAPGWFAAIFATSDLGMTLFFVLSGFVIAYNYADLDWRGDLRGSLTRFARLRFSRLYPALTVFVLLSLVLSRPQWPDALTAIHLLAVQTWWPLPAEMTIGSRYGISWSISTEIAMYFMFAGLMALGTRLRMLAVVLYLSGLGWLAISIDDPGTRYWLFYLSPYFRFLEFGAGVLLAIGVTKGWIVVAEGRWLAAVLSSRPLIWVGTVSYSLYLFHGGVSRWVAARIGVPVLWNFTHDSYDISLLPTFAARLLIAFSVAFGLAAIGHFLIEMPAKSALRGIQKRRAVAIAK